MIKVGRWSRVLQHANSLHVESLQIYIFRIFKISITDISLRLLVCLSLVSQPLGSHQEPEHEGEDKSLQVQHLPVVQRVAEDIIDRAGVELGPGVHHGSEVREPVSRSEE